MSESQWKAAKFPSFPLPNRVCTHVNVRLWAMKTEEMKSDTHLQPYVGIMEKVLQNLTVGCDLHVMLPGNVASVSPNYFQDPETDIPRIADALATEIKKGHMAGPLSPRHITDPKINGFMSISKPDGSRRQIGNLSHPPGISFNDGIDSKILDIWKVKQTTSKDFARMISRAGAGCIMSCSDMISAYKNLPVKLEQRRLQVFQFCGKHFVDLRLVFGDKCACMWYDMFHHCIVNFFVLTEVHMPLSWIGRTVDDIPTVSPKQAHSCTKSFVDKYRKVLLDLNIGAAAADPLRCKAFDGDTEGEVLGIRFNSVEMTWVLPRAKLVSLLLLLSNATQSEATLSLHDIEVLHGKLVNFAQHAPPLNLIISEVLAFLRERLEEFLKTGVRSRDAIRIPVPVRLKHDLKTVFAIVRSTQETPLPILDMVQSPSFAAIKVWSDASGHIIASPSIGVFIPGNGKKAPLVVSLALPRSFC